MARPTIDPYTRHRMAGAIEVLEVEQGMRYPQEVKIRLENVRTQMIKAGKMIYAVEELLAGRIGAAEFAAEIDGIMKGVDDGDG